ncbi:CUE domain-containing protein 2-A-like [Homarus americanus]|uniref:CUE domain-containing protein 2-A-like n=1 Tax=Homarus americanus TaxID=6706 RepID=UPI001C44CE37|nr:CUE domain-containing protein 2-A-like [Homarus americanus]
MSADADIVRSSLEKLLHDHSPSADTSGIDEIVVSYVSGVLEEVAVDDEEVDSAGMKDVMAAYVPEFDAIPEDAITSWVINMVHVINQEKSKAKAGKDLTLDALISSFPVETRKHCNSQSISETSERSQKLSETSNGSDEQNSTNGDEQDEYSEGLATLLEMFPGTCNLEVQHCLATCGGDLEHATTLILQRQEQGINIKTSTTSKLVPGAKGNKNQIDDKEVRTSILNRYGFVDHDDDAREHRPVAPKWEGKKMVRYRDNKVVSIKGERYTEIKKDESTDMKKTYVHLKPGKQYRFH